MVLYYDKHRKKKSSIKENLKELTLKMLTKFRNGFKINLFQFAICDTCM